MSSSGCTTAVNIDLDRADQRTQPAVSSAALQVCQSCDSFTLLPEILTWLFWFVLFFSFSGGAWRLAFVTLFWLRITRFQVKIFVPHFASKMVYFRFIFISSLSLQQSPVLPVHMLVNWCFFPPIENGHFNHLNFLPHC